MLLRYYNGPNSDRVYTLKEQAPDGAITQSAHPAKFSPDDGYSQERIMCKKRFNLLLTQGPKLNF